jgi:hypothetical protein
MASGRRILIAADDATIHAMALAEQPNPIVLDIQ